MQTSGYNIYKCVSLLSPHVWLKHPNKFVLMKPFFIFLIISLFSAFGRGNNYTKLMGPPFSNQSRIIQAAGDSSEFCRFVNASSLERLPAVIRDLNVVLNRSIFNDVDFLDGEGFTIYLSDLDSKSFEKSGSTQKISDTLYHVKLNRYNSRATDKALAVTLIHETMHCLLLDLDRKARRGDKQAVACILRFGLPKNHTSNFFTNDFFFLMNSGEAGQHELMYQLLYSHMVALLEDFESIHENSFLDHFEAEYLMWSGLQFTNAYKKLRDEEKFEIALTIRRAKGIE